ncbi:MAG: hypothetical protein ACK5LK_07995 [Chthoniobacterales bacterium]
MLKKNSLLHITWLFLILLTAIGYAYGTASHATGSIVPLLAASAKFMLVAWFFMKLYSVSRLWIFGLGTLMTGILGMIYLIRFDIL